MERNFLVLLRRFRLLKEQSYFNIFVCSFLRPHGETRRFLSEFCGSSKLCGFVHWSWQLKEYGLCQAQTNLYVLAPPAQCAHKSPPFLGEIIKRRGLLPLTTLQQNTREILMTDNIPNR